MAAEVNDARTRVHTPWPDHVAEFRIAFPVQHLVVLFLRQKTSVSWSGILALPNTKSKQSRATTSCLVRVGESLRFRKEGRHEPRQGRPGGQASASTLRRNSISSRPTSSSKQARGTRYGSTSARAHADAPQFRLSAAAAGVVSCPIASVRTRPTAALGRLILKSDAKVAAMSTGATTPW